MKHFENAWRIGFVLWVAETAYFGWNLKAGSEAERLFDSISLTLVVYGIIGVALIRIGRAILNDETI